MSNSNSTTTLQKSHLNDWLLEAWANHPITTDQHEENFKECFYAAKTYSPDIKTALLLKYIERIKRLKQEIIAANDVDKIGIKIDAIRITEFKQYMLAAVIGECSKEANHDPKNHPTKND